MLGPQDGGSAQELQQGVEGGIQCTCPGRGGRGVGSGICTNLKGSKAAYLEFHNLGKK